MKSSVAVILVALILIGTLDIIPSVQAKVVDKRGIDWGDVDPFCTVSCGAYWLCVVKSKDCKRPENCVCEQFATDG